jgi:hypothetical protein
MSQSRIKPVSLLSSRVWSSTAHEALVDFYGEALN